MRGVRRLTKAVAVLAGAAGVLLLAAPRPPARVDAIGAWCATGVADVALARTASLAAWGCLAWLTVVIAATLAGQAPSGAGVVARVVALSVAPAAVRAAAAAAFGAGRGSL